MLIFCIFLSQFLSLATLVMTVMKKVAKSSQNFCCKICDYFTSKQCNLNKHLLTAKHQKMANGDVSAGNGDVKSSKNIKLSCPNCLKQYNSHNGIWLHKKKCNVTTNNDKIGIELELELELELEQELEIEKNTNTNLLKNNNLVEYLIKENSEFKNLIMELVKKDNSSNNTNNIINNNNCNNINNSFNLNVFLNEKCKDAINISEFIDNIKMQLTDLETFGHVGYVEGVSRIFIKGLNALDTYKRPIHCSDLKREVIYIKDNDQWTKETEEKPILKNTIKQVASKNIKQINNWVKEHPNCTEVTSKKNDQYLKIVMNSMSGSSNEEQYNNIDKIAKNVTKAVIIEKHISL